MNTAEICEKAHEKLKVKCKRLNIIMDKEADENGNIHYTDQAQDMFDNIRDEIEAEQPNECGNCSREIEDGETRCERCKGL